MNWNCAQTEARLSDYLDGTLTTAEQQAADAHVAACARCAEWLDARRAVLWLRRVEPLPVPLGLETRILVNTTGLAPRVGIWDAVAGAWAALSQPRVAFSLAATVFSLALVLQTLNVDVRDLSARDFSPANIYYKVNRTLHVAYGRGVKFVNDLRLVYEIRSRLEEFRPATQQPEPKPSPPQPRPEPKPEKNFTDDGGGRKLYAFQVLAGPALHRPDPARYTR